MKNYIGLILTALYVLVCVLHLNSKSLTPMETKHTPGPWIFIGDSSGLKTALELIVHPDAEHSGGDSILYHHADWPISEANERLIAAAPDLLKALQNILFNLDDMGVKVANRLQADEAIRKAT